MRKLTQNMIEYYKLMKLKYDFMGYQILRKQDLSFHHLIVPRRECKEKGLGDGYIWLNGAILNLNTSHKYLHLIEAKDYDRFLAITSEMIDENFKGYLDKKNLLAIDDILNGFEREYAGIKSNKGKELIKEEYTRRLIRR